MYFAALTLPELVPILTIVAGMLIGFYKISEKMLDRASAERESDRQERQKLAEAIEKMAVSSEKVATSNVQIATEVKGQSAEIKTGNEQSAERNGHLGELIVEQSKQSKALAERVTNDILRAVKTQTVENLEVHHQHIESKE